MPSQIFWKNPDKSTTKPILKEDCNTISPLPRRGIGLSQFRLETEKTKIHQIM